MKYHQLPSSFKKRNNSLKKTITYLPNAPVSLNCQLFARSPRRFFSALHNTAGARAACVVTRPTQLMSSPRASGAHAPRYPGLFFICSKKQCGVQPLWASGKSHGSQRRHAFTCTGHGIYLHSGTFTLISRDIISLTLWAQWQRKIKGEMRDCPLQWLLLSYPPNPRSPKTESL